MTLQRQLLLHTERTDYMFGILTPEQMKRAEQASVKLGVSLSALMDNAGKRLGREVLASAQQVMSRDIVILVGSGNNGGDGLVCANYLYESGVVPTVILVCGEPKTDLAKAVFSKLYPQIRVIDGESAECNHIISDAGIIVDCVFGTGFRGEMVGQALEIFKLAQESVAYKIACDLPSGVNALNGQVSAGTLHSDRTVTFHRTKLGMLLCPANEYCGEITVVDIGLPDGWEQEVGYSIEKAELSQVMGLLPTRRRDSHKGSYGKLMLVCGSEKYMGAAMVSASSALRSGVGIANLCTPKSVASALVSAMPECIFTTLEADEQGCVSESNLPVLIEMSKTASAMVIGCGLGVTDGTKKLVEGLIRASECPVILDADGINCLSEHIDILEEKQSEIILTPHPAELSRLCGVGVSDIIADRLGYAVSLAEKYGVTVHAKGTQTITATPSGCCYISDFGNTALAKGGSGDLLAGLIGSFVAQGIKIHDACILGSCLMGCTAERLSVYLSERGIVASDIINAIPEILKEWEK